MQIVTIWKRFEAFECHSKGISRIGIQILTIQKRFEAFECHSKGISGEIQILTIQKGFEAFEFKFEPFKEFESKF